MPDPTSHAPAEAVLIKQLHAIEARISELQAERDALQRVIARIAVEGACNIGVSRKNSVNRILVESIILRELSPLSRSLSNSDLYVYARSVDHKLKNSTFRSYIHRLKERGFIETIQHGGPWRLTEKGRLNINSG